MCSRGPATSISPGATTRSVSVPSSCQDSRRSRAGPTLAPAATATVSAPRHAHRLGDVLDPAQQRHAEPDQPGPVPAGQAGADDLHAAVALLAQLRGQVGHRLLTADGEHAVGVATAGPAVVDPLAEPVVPEERQHQRQRQRPDDVAARDVRLQRVRDEADRRCQTDERTEDPLELLRAEPDHPGLVATGQSDGRDPERRRGERRQRVAVRRRQRAVREAATGMRTSPRRRRRPRRSRPGGAHSDAPSFGGGLPPPRTLRRRTGSTGRGRSLAPHPPSAGALAPTDHLSHDALGPPGAAATRRFPPRARPNIAAWITHGEEITELPCAGSRRVAIRAIPVTLRPQARCITPSDCEASRTWLR